VDDDGNISDFETHPGVFTKGKRIIDDLSPNFPITRENPLEIREFDFEPASWTVSGSKTGGKRGRNLIVPGSPSVNLDYSGPTIGLGAYYTQAVSRLNPNTPIVDLPLFLFELKDLPGMLRDLGRVVSRQLRPSDVPGGYVALKFGWQPLISDLYKLLTLGEELEAQKARIESMAKRGTASGRLSSVNAVVNGPNSSLTLNNKEYTFVYPYTKAKQQVWFSAILEPDFSAPYWAETRWDQTRRVLGLNLSLATIWNAIPWSWLVDYFTDIGAYLDSTRGILPFSLESITIMVSDDIETKYKVDTSTLGGPNLTKSGKYKLKYKRRFPMGAPNGIVQFKQNPMVGKLPILGSLFTATLLRKYGR
jgi:hypothetical protein